MLPSLHTITYVVSSKTLKVLEEEILLLNLTKRHLFLCTLLKVEFLYANRRRLLGGLLSPSMWLGILPLLLETKKYSFCLTILLETSWLCVVFLILQMESLGLSCISMCKYLWVVGKEWKDWQGGAISINLLLFDAIVDECYVL